MYFLRCCQCRASTAELPLLMNTTLSSPKARMSIARVRLPSFAYLLEHCLRSIARPKRCHRMFLSFTVLGPRFPVRIVYQITQFFRAAIFNDIAPSSTCTCFWPLLSFKTIHWCIFWYIEVPQKLCKPLLGRMSSFKFLSSSIPIFCLKIYSDSPNAPRTRQAGPRGGKKSAYPYSSCPRNVGGMLKLMVESKGVGRQRFFGRAVLDRLL